MESLTAAVRCGADAVYLGAGAFNARRSADNFSGDALRKAVSLAHLHGTAVHLTLNTLVSDREIPDCISLIEEACDAGVDAFIVQDLAVARLLREIAPEVELHASTQMAAMNAAGFRELEDLGFDRAVLPRELSLKEIREIRKQTTLTLECFVHGALCMCVSGQCYLSSMLGGRSGNRGLCAQPCRLPFGAPGGTGSDLSLKDLDLIESLPDLLDAGVTSFKIEGRMKRPEYVAAAVTACRNAVNGTPDPALTRDLQAVFSRSGFTDGYLTGKLGRQMFGTRQKEDVTAAAPVLKSLSARYAQETSPNVVDLTFSAHLGAPAELTAKDKKRQICAISKTPDPVQAAQRAPAVKEKVFTQISKTGGTVFTPGTVDLTLDEGLFLPASALNALRRDALDNLADQIVALGRKPVIPDRATLPGALPEHPVTRDPDLFVRFPAPGPQTGEEPFPDALLHALNSTKVILPLRKSDLKRAQCREHGIPFGVELPRALYGDGSPVERELERAKAQGASFVFAGTIDGVTLARRTGLPVLGGSTLNAFNSLSLEEWEKLGVSGITVSPELTLREIRALRGTVPRGIFAYGRFPLMLTRNCPIRNGTDCRTCQGTRSLTDRKGISFPVVCNNGGSELLNSRPLWLADRLPLLSELDFLLLSFTTENLEEILTVLAAYRTGGSPLGEFTRGRYDKGVQ